MQKKSLGMLQRVASGLIKSSLIGFISGFFFKISSYPAIGICVSRPNHLTFPITCPSILQFSLPRDLLNFSFGYRQIIIYKFTPTSSTHAKPPTLCDAQWLKYWSCVLGTDLGYEVSTYCAVHNCHPFHST